MDICGLWDGYIIAKEAPAEVEELREVMLVVEAEDWC